MEREWSCYGGGQFNGGRMIMLERLSVLWRENGHFTEVLTHFNGGRMVMLRRSKV